MNATEVQTTGIQARQGEQVRLKGYVQAVRNLGNIVFLVVRDAASTVQAVAHGAEVVAVARNLVPETVVIIDGSVVPQARNKSEVEVAISHIEIVAEPQAVPPIELSKNSKVDTLSLSTMLDYRPITLRNEKARAIFRIEAELCAAFREFLGRERFVEIHSPKIVSTGTEGGANVFPIEYFGRKAFLAQSPQFYKQMMVGVFERVFEIGPVYRAEPHDTTRHLNEYISMDFEMGFIENEQDLIAMQTRLLSHMFERVREFCARELALFDAVVPEVVTIPQLKHWEAIELLQKKLGWKGTTSDLDPESERMLCQHFEKQYGSPLVYITHYPLQVRPFYAMPAPAEGTAVEPLSHSFDLLFRGLEITTGGQRIHKYEELVRAMESRGLDPAEFGDYLQCFKYAMPPHGGLALGLERVAKQLLGLPTVKLASLFPRDINRMSP